MSFTAIAKVDDEEMNVLQCSFSLSQAIDVTGMPSAVPVGGTINLLVESTGEVSLFEWMKSPTQKKNGTITFYRRDSIRHLKTLVFTDAYCVEYHESFNHSGDHPMQIQLTISAMQLKLNDAEFTNNWPV